MGCMVAQILNHLLCGWSVVIDEHVLHTFTSWQGSIFHYFICSKLTTYLNIQNSIINYIYSIYNNNFTKILTPCPTICKDFKDNSVKIQKEKSEQFWRRLQTKQLKKTPAVKKWSKRPAKNIILLIHKLFHNINL